MDAGLLAALVSGSAALAIATVSYWLAKRAEREAEWRRLKLDHYRQYIASLSAVVGKRSTPEAQARYADAVNSLTLVAPRGVLQELYQFQEEISHSNPRRSLVEHNAKLSALLRAMRRDIHPVLRDSDTFVFRLMDVPPEVQRGEAQESPRLGP